MPEKKNQSARFIKKARELGPDESTATFDKVLQRLAKPLRKARPTPQKKRRARGK